MASFDSEAVGEPVKISWCTSAEVFRDVTAAGFRFSRETPSADVSDGIMALEMPVLGAPSDTGFEIWLCGDEAKFSQVGNVRYVEKDATVFGYVCLPEAPGENLEDLTCRAYMEALDFVRSLGNSHVWRFWNYFADINEPVDGVERYRLFNIGRQRAFDSASDLLAAGMPAASAIGIREGGVSIVFLAGAEPSKLIENPRQVSAYKYPEQYGPRSPSFSRAGLVHLCGSSLLLVSGTASIVGHETVNVNDSYAQTLTSLQNIGLVVLEAEKQGAQSFPMHEMLFRVYVRNARDYVNVAKGFSDFFREMVMPSNVHYVLGDICRSDLLVEIEASGCFAKLD